jgi:hypothetical protein
VSGLSSHCNDCQKVYSRKKYEERREDWALRLLGTIRARLNNPQHKKKVASWGTTLDFDAEFLRDLYAKQEGRCYYTELLMDLTPGRNPWSISLDRIDNSRGYTKDNVVLATRAANLGRSDAEPEEMLAYIQMIKEV